MSRKVAILVGLLGVLVAGAVVVPVVLNSGDVKLSNLMPAGATKSPQFRASYIDNAKTSCIKATNAQSPNTPAQTVSTYCECMANGSVDLMTEDDMKYMLDHLGSVPPDFQERLRPLMDQCLKQAGVK